MTDFFSLFDLPMTFYPDPVLVKQKYYELSRQLHPDRAATTTTESLLASASVNEAFKVLRNPDATMEYILKQLHLIEDQEKYTLPPDFLMEMMELNETLSELEPGDEPALKKATLQLSDLLAQWQQDADRLTTLFDGGNRSRELLLDLKDFYYRKKYLLRIKERIDKFAAQS